MRRLLQAALPCFGGGLGGISLGNIKNLKVLRFRVLRRHALARAFVLVWDFKLRVLDFGLYGLNRGHTGGVLGDRFRVSSSRVPGHI